MPMSALATSAQQASVDRITQCVVAPEAFVSTADAALTVSPAFATTTNVYQASTPMSATIESNYNRM